MLLRQLRTNRVFGNLIASRGFVCLLFETMSRADRRAEVLYYPDTRNSYSHFVAAWGRRLRRNGGGFAKPFMRILRAFAVSLSGIICAFLPPTANARNAEGDPWRSWLSPGCCITARILGAFLSIY